MKKLQTKDIESKAAELSKKFDNKVTPVFFTVDGEQIVGYFQEPNYDTLMYAIDCYNAGDISKAAEAALKDCLLVDESDARILSTERKNAKIKASFTTACVKFVAPYVDEYKKK